MPREHYDRRPAQGLKTQEDRVLDSLVTAINAIHMADDRRGLLLAVEAGCASFGFDSFVLFCHKPDKRAAVADATLTNASPSFLADYVRLGWWEADFLLDEVIAFNRSVTWSVADPGQWRPRQRRYLDFLLDNHMVQGLAVPLSRRPGSFSGFAISCRGGETLHEGAMQVTTIIGNTAMAKAELLGLCQEARPQETLALKTLSKIQHEILSWIVEGKSNVDIATIVGLNERAVRYHVTEILRKLGVVSRAQAATIWLASGGKRTETPRSSRIDHRKDGYPIH